MKEMNIAIIIIIFYLTGVPFPYLIMRRIHKLEYKILKWTNEDLILAVVFSLFSYLSVLIMMFKWVRAEANKNNRITDFMSKESKF